MIDLTGKRFGRWQVIERGPTVKTQISWLCKCECGIDKFVVGYSLRHGTSQSCGCLTIEKCIERSGSNSPSWKGGRQITSDGYVRIGIKCGKTELEHRLVMANYLGRK